MTEETADEVLLRAASTGDIETVRGALAAGANPNARDGFFKTPALQSAAEGGHKEVVLALLAAGADVHVRGVCRRTPLHGCAEKAQVAMLKLLVGDHWQLRDIMMTD